MRLAVLVSGRGSNLRAIARAIEAGTCRAKIAAVVSDRPSAAALGFANEAGIPTRTAPLSRGDDREQWNRALTRTVSEFEPDLVVLAGFMRIVGTPFLERFGGRIINVHPSLLPAFPGKDGPAQALAAGIRISGCTVHLVDHGVDTGRILAQAAVPVLAHDSVDELHSRIQKVEHRLLPAVIDWISNGALSLKDAATPSGASGPHTDPGAVLASPQLP